LRLRRPFCVQAKRALSRYCKLACIRRRYANAPTTERPKDAKVHNVRWTLVLDRPKRSVEVWVGAEHRLHAR